MALGYPSMGIGEYLAMWAIVLVVFIGAVGFFFGTGLGGVVVFVIVGGITVLLLYALMSRLYRFLLYGSIRADGDSGARGGD